MPRENRVVRAFRRTLLSIAAILAGALAQAHVPCLEEKDFTPEAPFVCPSAERSIAVSAWLESAGDMDVWAVRIDRPITFSAGLLVPAVPHSTEFRPAAERLLKNMLRYAGRGAEKPPRRLLDTGLGASS